MWAQIDRELGVDRLANNPASLAGAGSDDSARTGRPAGRCRHVVGFLATSKGDYLTGQAINVTGGLVMY